MKIESINVNLVDVHDPDSFSSPAARLPVTRQVVTVSLRSSHGAFGIGFAFVYKGLVKALLSVTEELAARLVGEHPAEIAHLHAKLEKHAGTFADSGMFLAALSAIDTALWDLKGKHAGLPLWQLLGGSRSAVRTYASGPLHRGLSNDEVADEASRLAAKGFRYMKLHLGLDGESTVARELERAQHVLDAVGPDVNLMCDINERWTVGDAVTIGTHLANAGLYCIEDPIHHHDYAGLARVTESVPTRIMAGENWWGSWSFQHAFAARSVDIAMIDIMHVGGVTNWMKVAAMADAANLKVVSHIMPEIQAHLVAASPNGLMSEHKEWNWELFEGCPHYEKGQLFLSERPGHGLSFRPSYRHLE